VHPRVFVFENQKLERSVLAPNSADWWRDWVFFCMCSRRVVGDVKPEISETGKPAIDQSRSAAPRLSGIVGTPE